MVDNIDIPKCDVTGCDRIATHIIDNYHPGIKSVCFDHYQESKRLNKESKPINAHKIEKIIETYLDLAEIVQQSKGSVSVIKDYRDKPLSEFLEDICSTNNIRFKHNKNGS